MFKINCSTYFGLFFKITILLYMKSEQTLSAVLLNSDGEYSGIYVAINEHLQTDCEDIVTSLTDVFNEATNSLQAATGMMKFSDITVVIPENWENCGSYQINETDGLVHWNNADFRIGPWHPIFGDEPWTKQPRGCGLKGNFIYLPTNWLYKEVSNKGSRLLSEWAKYRWGVFEEYGHYMDKIYPGSYRDASGIWTPNYCTNVPLKGDYDTDCELSSDCKFNIDSSILFSSLMAVPDLFGVTSFCDDSTHQGDIPTKHNLICEGKSVQSVLEQHQDFIGLKHYTWTVRPERSSVIFSVVRERKTPTVIIAFEASKFLSDIPNQFEFLKEAISQFILYEIPSTAKMGLVSFGKYNTLLSDVMKLDASSRRFLADKVLDSIAEGTSVDLLQAILLADKTLGSGNGVILLVTKCTRYNPSYSAQELYIAAHGHPVWIVLYPYVSDLYLSLFTELAALTGGQVIIVEQELVVESGENILMSSQVRMKLSQAFREILHFESKFDLRQIDYEACSQKSCKVDLQIKPGYNPKTNLYLYYSSTDIVSNVTYINGASCVTEKFGKVENTIQTTSVLKCNLNENADTLSLTVNRQLAYEDLIVELAGHPRLSYEENNSEYEIKVYSYESLHNLQYKDNSAPIILSEVLYKEKLIYNANVAIHIPLSNSLFHTISMTDDGTGADITGNDGVYSAYLAWPILPVGDFVFNITANNNSGGAGFIPNYLYGKEKSDSIKCCPSTIPLGDILQPTGPFNLTKNFCSGRITYSFDNLNLPPGQIKDLAVDITKKNVKTKTVVLKFTAPGEDLDFGTASKYILITYKENKFSADKKLLSNIIPKASGTRENIIVGIEECDVRYIFAIAAMDELNQSGPHSNNAFVYVPCHIKEKLNGGAVFGIVLACIILVALVVLFIRWRKRNKSKKANDRHNRSSTLQLSDFCSCCKSKELLDDSSTIQNPTSSYVRPPRVEHIRNIHDLNQPVNMMRGDAQFNQDHGSENVRATENLQQATYSSPLVFNNYIDVENKNDYDSKENIAPIILDKSKSVSKGSISNLSSSNDNPINQLGIPISHPDNKSKIHDKNIYSRSLDNILAQQTNTPFYSLKNISYSEV